MTDKMNGWSRGTVTVRHDWAPGLCTLTIDVGTEGHAAGQFFNIGLPMGDQFVRRSYSVASAPGQPLEFLVNRVEDGSLSPQLVDLQPGGHVWVEPRARGFFTLDYVPTVPDLWLLATGTGLGPYLSMLREGALFARFERVVIVHGVRYGAHLAYAQEIEQLARARGGQLVRVPIVSREDVPGALRGRITDALHSGRLEERVGLALDSERSHVMMCGNPAMIEEMMTALETRGMRRHRLRSPGHVTFERYW
jgi:ferredoxin--NADP+ reductase